jgi:hypothetical protein
MGKQKCHFRPPMPPFPHLLLGQKERAARASLGPKETVSSGGGEADGIVNGEKMEWKVAQFGASRKRWMEYILGKETRYIFREIERGRKEKAFWHLSKSENNDGENRFWFFEGFCFFCHFSGKEEFLFRPFKAVNHSSGINDGAGNSRWNGSTPDPPRGSINVSSIKKGMNECFPFPIPFAFHFHFNAICGQHLFGYWISKIASKKAPFFV